MEKISCEVVKDLLPLYCDNVCSRDSSRLVEAHLKECQECCALLKKMETECSVSNDEERGNEEIVRGMAAVWKKSVTKSFLKGIFVAFCICFALAGTYWGLTRIITVAVSSEVVEATVVNITDEQIEINLTVTDGKKVPFGSMTFTDDGKCYIVIKRGVIPVINGNGENWSGSYSVPRVGTTEDGGTTQVKEIYCGTERDSILIWQEE